MLNRYYQNELNRLKSLAIEFARHNPALAPMLSGTSADPDVERLLEGVAFLTGMARQKLDDEFPEFVQELANLLFPHYLRPVPASTLVAFTPKGPLSEVARVAAGTGLASVPVDGTPCQFQTTAEVVVQPVQLTDVNVLTPAGAAPVLALDFELQGVDLSQWQADSLRFFLGGGYVDASKLLLLLSNHVRSVRFSADGAQRYESGPSCLRASGFDEAMLPYPSHAFQGYQRLQEFFVQPEKFLFIDIEGLDAWPRGGKATEFSIFITLDQLPTWMPEITVDSFVLNVTPAINLFDHEAIPINHEHRVSEYRVIPESRNRDHYRVYSIDHVIGFRQGVAKERIYQPFGMYRHDGRSAGLTYRVTQRPATVGRGSETFLSLNYPLGEDPVPEAISLRITCTNRSLPVGLKLGDVSQSTSTSPDRMAFRNIRPVTPPQEPPLGDALLWRLISHVSLNYLSLADAAALQGMLNLYVSGDREEPGANAANRRRIDGIQNVTATPETRLAGRGGVLRGQLIRIRCRLDHYAGLGDLYVFGCVLERFLADYAGINSYTRVELEDSQSGALFKWPPRLGQQTLL